MKHDRISTFFENDHREIDALLAEVPFHDSPRAVAGFEAFDRRLERHIDWEEEILFPAVCEKGTCLEHSPIRVMKMEHVEIRSKKAAALAALRSGDGTAARRNIDAMLAVLKGHNMKEEQVLYPACDELLNDAERLAILARVGGARAARTADEAHS